MPQAINDSVHTKPKCKAIKVKFPTKINFTPHKNIILVTLIPNLQNLPVVNCIGVMAFRENTEI